MCFLCGCHLVSCSAFNMRVRTTILSISVAADDLQDPGRFTKTPDGGLHQAIHSPNFYLTGSFAGNVKTDEFQLVQPWARTCQQGTLGFGLHCHLKRAVIKVTSGIYHPQGERQDSSALVNLLPSQWHCTDAISVSCIVPKLPTSVRNSKFYFILFESNGFP